MKTDRYIRESCKWHDWRREVVRLYSSTLQSSRWLTHCTVDCIPPAAYHNYTPIVYNCGWAATRSRKLIVQLWKNNLEAFGNISCTFWPLFTLQSTSSVPYITGTVRRLLTETFFTHTRRQRESKQTFQQMPDILTCLQDLRRIASRFLLSWET